MRSPLQSLCLRSRTQKDSAERQRTGVGILCFCVWKSDLLEKQLVGSNSISPAARRSDLDLWRGRKGMRIERFLNGISGQVA
jgi:hypothetical protein